MRIIKRRGPFRFQEGPSEEALSPACQGYVDAFLLDLAAISEGLGLTSRKGTSLAQQLIGQTEMAAGLEPASPDSDSEVRTRRRWEDEEEVIAPPWTLDRIRQERANLPDWTSFPPLVTLTRRYHLSDAERFVVFLSWVWRVKSLESILPGSRSRATFSFFAKAVGQSFGEKGEIEAALSEDGSLFWKGLTREDPYDTDSGLLLEEWIEHFLATNDESALVDDRVVPEALDDDMRRAIRQSFKPEELNLARRVLNRRKRARIMLVGPMSGEDLEAIATELARNAGLEPVVLRPAQYAVHNLPSLVRSNAPLCSENQVLIIRDLPGMLGLVGPQLRRDELGEQLELVVIRSPVRILWVTPSIKEGSIDPGNFDFVLRATRQANGGISPVWSMTVTRLGLSRVFSREDLEKFSVEYPLHAGDLESVLKTWREVKPAGKSFRKSFDLLKELLDNKSLNLAVPPPSLAPLSEVYDPSLTNTTPSLDRVERAMRQFQEARQRGNRARLNILLEGPPGSGKTEWVKYITQQLGLNLVQARASDLLNAFVGRTEQNIARFFSRGQVPGNLLFLDEVDSLLYDRNRVRFRYETSMINELLSHLDQYTGLCICATNHADSLDLAVLRRFAFKVSFHPLPSDRLLQLVKAEFPRLEFTAEQVADLMALKDLTPGDVRAVRFRTQYLPDATAQEVLESLAEEARLKSKRRERVVGFGT